jgi:hypothetical protein
VRTLNGRSLVALVTTLAILALGCESAVGPDQGLSASIVGDSLRLENGTPRPTYFFEVEAGLAARINWAPCSDPRTCQAVAPGSALMIPLTDVFGFEEDSEVVLVYWWYLVPRRGKYQPDAIRTTGARR